MPITGKLSSPPPVFAPSKFYTCKVAHWLLPPLEKENETLALATESGLICKLRKQSAVKHNRDLLGGESRDSSLKVSAAGRQGPALTIEANCGGGGN